jgi:probable phosphoglycerate mutase
MVSRPRDGIGSGPLWLVRHASTDWTGVRWCGRSDPELNEVGRVRATQLAEEIRAELAVAVSGRPAVLTSPLRRAVATAQAIAAALGTRPRIELGLVEVDFGAADGLSWEELADAYPLVADAVLHRGDVDWPVGETALEVRGRAAAAAGLLLDAAAGGPVVAVAHGGILAAVLPLFDTRSQSLEVAPGTAIRLDPRGIR